MKLTRFNDLETQMMGGTAAKSLRELMSAGSIATQLGGSTTFGAGTALAEMQARVAEAGSAFASLRHHPGLATAGKLSAILSPLDQLTSRLTAISDAIGTSKSGLRPEVLAAFAGAIGNASRLNQWAGINGIAATAALASMTGGRSDLKHEVGSIRNAVASAAASINQEDRLRLSAALGIGTVGHALRAATQTRFAAFAGAGDVLGFGALTSVTAYHEIFGEWHTSRNLPQRFWRDPSMRRRRYEEAAVDPGLIEATPSEAIEIVISSGFVAGAADRSTSVALVDVGGVAMQIRSANTAADAYKALVQFEQSFRAFLAAKLLASAGPKWMKQRIDGPVFAKAKENRAKALGAGERESNLLAFVDIGDLAGIIFRRDNWDQIFGSIFPNRERLAFDIETVIATRRSTMHARKIDAVRLVELICVIRRLTQWMDDDGYWRLMADDDSAMYTIPRTPG
jgi:hypothetical protein